MRTSNNLENMIPSDTTSIYKSSGLQFFRTTTGIQSGPGAFVTKCLQKKQQTVTKTKNMGYGNVVPSRRKI